MSVSKLFLLIDSGDEQAVQNYLNQLNTDQRVAKLDEVQQNLFWHASTDRYLVKPGGYNYYQWDGWYTQDLTARYRANTPRGLNPDLVKRVLEKI